MQRLILIILMSFGAIMHVAKADSNWNLRTAPVSDAIGIYNVELDYKVSDKFTLGPMFYHFDYELSDTNGT